MRLDVLESELKLPFKLDSGHIHELRINIPWMALGSESVKVKISTIELSASLSKEDEEDEEGNENLNQSYLSSETASYRQKPKVSQEWGYFISSAGLFSFTSGLNFKEDHK